MDIVNKSLVRVIKISTTEYTPQITSFGNISYQKKIEITSPLEATMKNVYVEEGDNVYKNQKLAQMENIQLTIKRNQAQMAVKVAESAVYLAETRYIEGQTRVEAELLSLEKTELAIQQKEKEIIQAQETLENKKVLFEVGGIPEEAIQQLELQFSSQQTSYKTLLKDFEIQQIGFRDEDILRLGFSLPENKKEKKQLLIEINTLTLKAEYEDSKIRLENTKEELRSTETLLSELTIKSPITGIIGSKNIEEGARVQANSGLFTIFDSSNVYVIFNIQESQGHFIREGQLVDVIVDAIPDEMIRGKIDLISPIIDPQTGNLTIKAIIENSDKKLNPGMFARVKVIYGEKKASIFIPESSIVKKQGENAMVFVVVNNRVFGKKVKLGINLEGQYEILTGLKAGEFVIDNPSPLLHEGEEVEIIK